MDDVVRRGVRGDRRRTAVSGSLNLVLNEPWALPPQRIRVSAEQVAASSTWSRARSALAAASSSALTAEQAGGGEHRVLEILSDVRLRDELGVDDGDTIEVVIDDLVGS